MSRDRFVSSFVAVGAVLTVGAWSVAQAGQSQPPGPPLAHPDWPELSMPGPPTYPPDALAAKKGGWVPLEIDVAADGRVTGVRERKVEAPGAVSSATAPSLVAAAITAARQARIYPPPAVRVNFLLFVNFDAREGSVTLLRTPPAPPPPSGGPGAPNAAGPGATAVRPPAGPPPIVPLDEALVAKYAALVRANPEDVSNYHALAKAYEDAGENGRAEDYLLQAKARRPNLSAVYLQLAGFYHRQGNLAKATEAISERSALDPNDAEPHFVLATYHWDKVFRDASLTESDKRATIAKGLKHVERALALRADYADAMLYKGLLLRAQAMLEKDEARKQQLVAEANRLRDEAARLKKR